MEPRLTEDFRTGLIFIILLSAASSDENDRDFQFCGTWRHDKVSLNMNFSLSPGCSGVLISANESSLSIVGEITAHCHRSGVIELSQTSHAASKESYFCLYWEPLLDQLWVQFGGKNHTLCWPAGLQDSCCTDLSQGPNRPEAPYGIFRGKVNGDIINTETMTAYKFSGMSINCKQEFCDKAGQRSSQVNMIEETVMRSQAVGNVELPCALSTVVEMKDDFHGYNVTLPAPKDEPPNAIPMVYLPPSLKKAAKKKSKVICTFFRNTSLFQEDEKKVTIINEVVGITIENEIITDLSEPVRIDFHHNVIPNSHSRICVSWDTNKDPLKVNWLQDGCETHQIGEKNTVCLCSHLTYFTILVQLEPRPVRHLLALTVITSLGCALSVFSCIVLIIFLCKTRRYKEQAVSIHMGLAVSLLLLNLLFFFTGTLANLVGESICAWVGASLHYALLSSLTWMALEVFHTFWLVSIIFSPTPKTYVWNLIGFGFPVVPVVILVFTGDFYGVRRVTQMDDTSSPYLMCWMKDSQKALLAHYFTNMTLLAILVVSGLAMLFLVYREIRKRDEWKQHQVAFLSIWGLSCLFGTTWGLTFLDFKPLSDVILFLSCILNSFQGFLLMLRFYILDRMRKRSGRNSSGSSSTGSTRQHMLQPQEKH
ncbi:adhesion G-protein coupled receptor G5-like [Thalassophryne amazonica]|uniref:adhesion G-protein coupled receptor G5-like n=1 Tax=Thalassophryne amazonica TaxID=390379 RepID=UPI0014719B7C|nr:adhesion G-protein coupled receptor G5-like [Thalassophryne amazonica]